MREASAKMPVMSGDPTRLTMDPDDMRRLGYAVVDRIIDHLEGLEDAPVSAPLTRAEAETLFREEPPETGTDPMTVLDQALQGPLKHAMRVDHPRFFGYVPCAGNFISTMAETLSSGFNVFAGSWQAAPGASEIEIVVLDWLATWCGFPREAGGVMVSGGSAANLTALAAARIHKIGESSTEGVVYFSDQTHSSVERGLLILGVDRDRRRQVPSDERQQMDVAALRRMISEDKAAGHRPYCVIANAGTTTSGAVDPLDDLADLCRDEDLWLHVDGAYGAASVICPEGRRELKGLERADSITIDPHKWLFQNLELGCVLVRDNALMRDAFQVLPAYLDGIHADHQEINFCDYGLQLTRSFRALKLWMSFKVFGVEAFREAVSRGFRMARHAEELVRADPSWEVVTPARMGIMTFRRVFAKGQNPGPDFHTRLSREAYSDGYAMFSSSVVGGVPVMRCCAIHPRTTSEDIELSLARLDHLARKLEAE